MMKQGYTILDHMRTYELPRFNQFPELWISEYNLMDGGSAVHGTWAHGLFTALVSLRFLEEDKITKAVIHNMVGDAVYSSLFFSNDGFCFGQEDSASFIPPIPTDSSCTAYPTNYLEKSAQGNTVSMLAQSVFDADSAELIQFEGAPYLSGSTYKTVYGYRFHQTANSDHSEFVILNVGSAHYTLNMDSVLDASDYIFNQLSNSPFIPVQGNMNIQNGNVNAGLLTLEPYSITRIYQPAPVLRAWASVDTICAGQSVALHARGSSNYNWQPSTGLSSVSGEDVLATPTASTVYTVTDANGDSTLIPVTVAEPFQITVNGLPSNAVCQGDSLWLSLSGGNNYLWDPKPDYIFSSNQDSVLILPYHTKSFTVYGTDGFSYCGEKIININIAGEIKLNTPQLICSGTADTLYNKIGRAHV